MSIMSKIRKAAEIAESIKHQQQSKPEPTISVSFGLESVELEDEQPDPWGDCPYYVKWRFVGKNLVSCKLDVSKGEVPVDSIDEGAKYILYKMQNAKFTPEDGWADPDTIPIRWEYSLRDRVDGEQLIYGHVEQNGASYREDY